MNKTHKTAVLLVNVGTPDSPTPKAVRRYLREFLNDPLVVDLPWLFRMLLVNCIIIPFRVNKSTNLYKRLWVEGSSPLLVNTQKMANKLSEAQNNYSVFVAMRYGNPSLKSVLTTIKNQGFNKVIVLPLYPQYSGATTQTTINKVNAITNKWKDIEIKFIEQFYHYSSFVDAFVSEVKQHNLADYDHILFSYHSLPVRQIEKEHKKMSGVECNCFHSFIPKATKCYQNSCRHFTALLADKLQLTDNDYTLCFQSRLNKDWLEPFTDKTLLKLAEQGNKKVLVISPSFVADCLETTIEIGIDYKDMFIKAGGEQLTLVESLNYSEEWISCIIDIINSVE